MASTLLRRRTQTFALLGAAGLVVGLVNTQTADAAPPPATATYLVQLAEAPAAGYTGGVAGYARTKPAAGTQIDADAPAVTRYRGYLSGRQTGVLRSAASAKAIHRYSVTFNGFAATMTATDAAKLARTPGVKAVLKDENRKLDTTRTPEFLGLTKDGGLWDQLGGPGRRGAGDGVVVGVLDSGLWPESPSLAPLDRPRRVPQFAGACQTGEEWTTADCSNKIVGARYYADGFTASNGSPDTVFPYEYLSARDADGHGTHTATTAAGNYGIPVSIAGGDFGRASGMAPNARVAGYKVCWGRSEAEAGCNTADSVKAIEDATTDGVDVINFSISGSTTSFVDPVELAFFGAAEAGVFVAASAGNSGPGASTVAHNSPWLTSVAAGTVDRRAAKSVTLGNGATYTGIGLGAAVPSSPLVLSTAAAAAGAAAEDARLCALNSLDPAKVTGKIVVCDRGVVDRVEKSQEVQRAGGVGMVLTNTSPNSLNADVHYVPTVHVDEVAGAAIKAYAATAGATAALSVGRPEVGVKAPQVASFSSRGPALAGGGDLLKPDIMAPGVDILAGVSPDGHDGRLYDFISGTSMSSPHVAGLAALIIQKNPGWSPMAVKSALMTTASQRDNKGQPISTDTNTPADPFAYGSGHVNPNAAADPGLVYESTSADWVRFLCGVGELAPTGSACQLFGTADPSDLNQPNIAVGALAGTQTVTRTVRNVGTRQATYVAFAQEPAGVDVTVTPSRVRIRPGGTATFKVTLTRTSAAFDEYAFGALTWSDGRHQVRSQLAVRPVAVAAPAEVTGTGTAGETEIPVTPGFTGQLSTEVDGLVAAEQVDATLQPTGPAFDADNPAESARVKKVPVTIPEGTTLARHATFDRDFTPGTDVDLFLYAAGTSDLVAQSAAGSSEEEITIPNPPAGTYDLYVVLYGAAAGETSVTVPTFIWTLGSEDAGNLTVTPASGPVEVGEPVTLTAAWSGLQAGKRYLGQIVYGDGTAGVGDTIVRVDA